MTVQHLPFVERFPFSACVVPACSALASESIPDQIQRSLDFSAIVLSSAEERSGRRMDRFEHPLIRFGLKRELTTLAEGRAEVVACG